MAKNIKNYFLSFIALALILNISSVDVSASDLHPLDEFEKGFNDIDKRDSDIDSRILKLEFDITNLENNKTNLKQDISKLNSEIERVDKNILDTEKRLDDKKKTLKKVQEELVITYNKISELQLELSIREESFRERIQSMHKTESVGIVDVVMTSSSIGDLLRRVSSYKTIVNKDNKVIEEYLDLSDQLKSEKEKSERYVKELESYLKELETIEENLNSDRLRNVNLKRDREIKSKSVSEQISILLKERESLLNEKSGLVIKKEKLEKEKVEFEKEEERKRLEEIKLKKELEKKKKEIANGKYVNRTDGVAVSKSGIKNFYVNIEKEIKEGRKFITPATGEYTSPVGPRWGTYHNGIDIANGVGNPIFASASGEVTVARPYSGYGNAVMIKHKINGIDYMTLYGHMSAFNVTPGQHVEQGDLIGLMGNTGNSTGPHLHFEIYEGGYWSNDYKYRIDPIKYLR